jgi:3-deoxy-D-manno-octulosonic-acid transferase
MRIIYNFAIFLMLTGMRAGRGFKPKWRKMLQGRKQLFSSLKQFRDAHPSPLVWFHVASLGEYEQAKPVIKAFKEKYPLWAVCVTFFSPSGYEPVIRKKQLWVDHMQYLPFDTAGNAKNFVDLLHPNAVFFVKYDLWANHILEVKRRQIPLFLVAAAFRKDQLYFKWYGSFFLNLLKCFDWIFTQREAQAALGKEAGLVNISRAGDPRYDNVKDNSLSPRQFPEIQVSKPVIVIGSAWQEDIDLLLPFLKANQAYQVIIAPHDIRSDQIQEWGKTIGKPYLVYSELNPTQGADWEVLFIDNIGMLSSLYQFARVAYVGGGSGKGLHNILEPLAFGIPVLFAKVKNEDKFLEAAISQEYGCGFAVNTFQELTATMNELSVEDSYKTACKAARKLVNDNLGSAKAIMEKVSKRIG